MNIIKDVSDYPSYKYNRKRGGWESLSYLIDKKVVKNLNGYFKILNESKEVLKFKSPKEVIEIIKDAGGHPFLAHPSSYGKGQKLSLDILKGWKDYGISGIECYSPYLKETKDADYYVKFCNENNLMISAGSDCHGDFNDRSLGIPKVNFHMLNLGSIKSINTKLNNQLS